MASAFSHLAIPLTLRLAGGRKLIPWRLLFFAMLLSVAPDFDSIAFRLDIPYDSQWGHRGFTHSIFFAALISLLAMTNNRFFGANRPIVFLSCFISMVSHGLLDACTTGGLGVAFFWPVTSERYFLPWQVIEVSPISFSRFFTEQGLTVLSSELYYIWLPCICVGLAGYGIRIHSQMSRK